MDSTQKAINKQQNIFEPFRNELFKEYSFWKLNLLGVVFVFSLFTSIFLSYFALRYIIFDSGSIQLIYNYPSQDWIRLPKLFLWAYIAMPIIYIFTLIFNARKIYEINPKIVVGLLWVGIFQNIFLIIGIYQIISLNV